MEEDDLGVNAWNAKSGFGRFWWLMVNDLTHEMFIELQEEEFITDPVKEMFRAASESHHLAGNYFKEVLRWTGVVIIVLGILTPAKWFFKYKIHRYIKKYPEMVL